MWLYLMSLAAGVAGGMFAVAAWAWFTKPPLEPPEWETWDLVPDYPPDDLEPNLVPNDPRFQ